MRAGGRIDRVCRGGREGRRGGLPGITGYGDDKHGDAVALSTLSPGPTGGGGGGAASKKPAGGILAHARQGTLSRPHPAWNLLFSRIAPDLHPPPPPPLHTLPYCRHLPLHSAHQQTPNEPASRKQTPAQPARSQPPPGSQGVWRRHFTRTDDAAKTTIMIINLLNLEDYAVN